MTSAIVARRIVTTVAFVIVLALSAGAIRIAAAWTAASAPLTAAPASVAVLQAALEDERARAAALTQQLEALDSRSQDLAAALGQAQGRISADAAHARDLNEGLASAKARLTKLETTLARARQALRTSRGVAASATTVSTAAEGLHEEEHEDDGD